MRVVDIRVDWLERFRKSKWILGKFVKRDEWTRRSRKRV
jgi:hypothetical protein